MELRSVAVLGGGPGGLYAARLLRLRDPECRVDLYEQSPPDRTFGFGVGLATRTQRNLEAADPDSLGDIVRAAWSHEMGMAIGDRKAVVPVDNLIAIGRSTLLEILRHRAEDAGAVLHYGERVAVDEVSADLVVAADGVNSATRERWADDFGASVTTHEGLYLWCGTDVALPSAVFRPVETEFGTFVAHAYPYQSDRSTFLVETDEATWRRAGFDASTDRTSPEESDEHSLAYLSKAFDVELDGHPLIGNRTRWLRFRTVRCARWHRGNVALLGDAVHTAHYSIGSGTKLAMEDAIALVGAVDAAGTLEEALAAYEAERQPAVEHLQETAHRSMRWWDSFPSRLDLGLEQLLIAYMTRAGKVTIDRFAALAPGVVAQGLADYAGVDVTAVPDDDRVTWVLGQPLVTDHHTWEDRVVDPASVAEPALVDVQDAWDTDADRLVAELAASHAGSTGVVSLTSAPDHGAMLTAFDVAERVKRATDAVVAVHVDSAHRELAAAALASGRADLVALGDA